MTAYCEEALVSIAYGIAIHLKAPDAASRWAQKMREEIRRLAEFPSRVPLTPNEPWHSFGLHRLVVGKYYIYFLIFEDKRVVRITDIVFQGMNQANRLAELPFGDLLK